MASFSEKEYLQLLEQLVNEQYDQDEDDIILPSSWIPAEPLIKETFNKQKKNSTIDLTKASREKIEDTLHGYFNLSIGKFLVKIVKYSYKSAKDIDATVDLIIYEKNKNNLIITKVNVNKDIRFLGRQWNQYFDQFNRGTDINIKISVNIIKWLQAIERIGCFI